MSTISPGARAAHERYKLEASAQLGVNLTTNNKSGIISLNSGTTSSQTAKKIILAHENGLQ